jgi:hypothetical protein
MEVEVPDLAPTDINRIMGVDVGQRYIESLQQTPEISLGFSVAHM